MTLSALSAIFSINNSSSRQFRFHFLNNLVLENSIKTVFGTGLLYANWSLKSDSALKNFVYIDDYEKCDSYYKYIYANNVENISTAVLYPFVDDEIINKDIKYRALYDSYAQRRFKSEACFVLNFDDFFIQEHFNIESSRCARSWASAMWR